MPRITPVKGRGSLSNHNSRFEALRRDHFDDGWQDHGSDGCESTVGPLPRLSTTVSMEAARSIISHNSSPDIQFDQSINPYRGCEHGCIYCYARPTHAYLNHSPGLDFETRLYAKGNAAEILRKELSRPAYRPAMIALGSNTDPYQPIERRLGITASVLQVLDDFNHPVGITTKSASIVRDIDLLSRMASRNLVRVFMSIGTLDRDIARTLEPRASTPGARMEAIRRLSDAGIPTGVIVAPVIPALNDHDIENILQQASEAGAVDAHYVLLRLPLEVAPLFEEWLNHHYPLKAAHVMSLLRQMRGGKTYDPAFRQRMRGTGVFAELLAQRFRKACVRMALNQRRFSLSTAAFKRPQSSAPQLSLF
ncbi:PA0069 family radical SAM protein [Allopusillimonas soli]|uniref:PA0069 family radical SAM protein n=1 Tax=Allopusillimonas soli TaxID=659016 RepID=A0A853F9W5_9BURK|nr:PA0069 family radical SAM protein [Allopusillimonas soli]NYT37484.1 PA0069 family radical SAM protein [Allopusillimonas soli]TEA74537.1 PA0069 family radical SAM protein [Allopusillimonas soli]